jgi:restriction system protein
MPPFNPWDIFWTVLKQMWPLLIMSWPLWLLIIAILFFRIMADRLGYEIENFVIRKKFRDGEKWRTGRQMIKWLQEMSPENFEKYVEDMFVRLGYVAKAVGGPNDGGIDVIAEKNGIKYYVQCKRYGNHNEVGVAAIRDFYGALADHLANGKGYFITTSKFTLQAEKFAEDKPIELIDGHRLLDYVRMANGEDHIPEGSVVSLLRCPRCGGELVERMGKYGKFHGCSNFPKCKFTTK